MRGYSLSYHAIGQKLPYAGLVQALEDGLTVTEICEEFGVCRALVYKKLKKWNLKPNHFADRFRHCPTCGRAFQPTGPNHIYCIERHRPKP